MPSRQTPESRAVDGNVDLLRVRLEQELPLPAVIAVTSAAADDGKEIIARALADSYALTGYSTLFIDTSLAFRTVAESPRGLGRTDIVRPQSLPDSQSGKLTVLTYNNLTLLRTTSLRSMKAVLGILRGKFDCVVISTESGTTDAFSAAIVAAADALLVTVRKGRRQNRDDRRLASVLERAGRRFLGLVTVEPAVIMANSPVIFPAPERPALAQVPRKISGLIGRVAFAVVNRLTRADAERAVKRPALVPPESADSPAPLIISQASRAS